MSLLSRGTLTVLLASLAVVSSVAPDTRQAAVVSPVRFASPTTIALTPDREETAPAFSAREAAARAEPLPRGAALRRRLMPEPSDPLPATESPPDRVPAAQTPPGPISSLPQPPPAPARPAAGAPAVPATPVPAPPTVVAAPAPLAPAAIASSAELRMLALINGSRAQGGLAPYALDGGVSAVARRHSGFEASLGYVYHDGADGTAAARDGAACGSGWFGENVGAVWNGNVDALHGQYMAEPWAPINHRTNIMDATFKRVGIGAARGGDAIYMTMVFCR